MKKFYLVFLIALTVFNTLHAQAPNISYTTPQVYTVNTPITSLAPANTGGAVPATIYGNTITFAGSGSQGSTNGAGNVASFYKPYGSCIDALGNVYMADTYNHLIRKIAPNKVVSTFAGNGFPGFNNATGTAASFDNPGGLAIDASGNVYVGDQTNNAIRKITPGGVVTTLAGNGSPGFANGTGTFASFNSPAGVALDGSGNLYVADRTNNAIRKITPAGVVTTFAGNGSAGSANGMGTLATFSNPTGVAVDANGNVFVADQFNYQIRKITSAGVVTTLAGSGALGATNGLSTAASFNKPFGVAVDQAGNVYVADEFNQLVREITPAGYVNTLAGNSSVGGADGIGVLASFNYPAGMVSDGVGNLYVTETGGDKIRKVVTTGYVIDKTLPAGLAFDPTTGIISGTPTAGSPTTIYNVTAYNSVGSSTTQLSITVLNPLPQTITFPPIAVKTYGDADLDPGATSTSGLPITYTSSNTAVAIITAGGKIHIIGVGTAIITALQAGGSPGGSGGSTIYSAATPVTQTITVKAAPLTITADNKTKVYGSANPPLTITYTGFVYNEGPANLITQPAIVTAATAVSPVNVYQITPSGATAANYIITYVVGQLTVTPAILTITADNQVKLVGAVNPPLTITYAGFVNGDTQTGLTPNVQTTATTTSPAGTYPITVSGVVKANYTLAYVPGILTVTPPQTITFTLFAKTYGDADFNAGATASSGLPVSYTSSNPAIATVSASGNIHITGVGTTIITASQSGSSSVPAATPVTQNFTVNPASLTITANNQSRVYGTANPVLTASYAGFVYGETAANLTAQPVLATTATVNSNVGVYPINVSGAVDANYNITYAPGALTITPASQTITFNPIPDQTIGGPDITLPITASSGLPVTISSSNPLIAATSGLTIKLLGIGTVTITATQAGNSNYLPATATQTLIISNVLTDLVLVHPLVTPNGDGINDILMIEGIDKYPDNRLTLVNKNGVKVYETTGYDNGANCFNGYSSITKTPQPQGTYFYSLQFTADGKTQKRLGYIVLKY